MRTFFLTLFFFCGVEALWCSVEEQDFDSSAPSDLANILNRDADDMPTMKDMQDPMEFCAVDMIGDPVMTSAHLPPHDCCKRDSDEYSFEYPLVFHPLPKKKDDDLPCCSFEGVLEDNAQCKAQLKALLKPQWRSFENCQKGYYKDKSRSAFQLDILQAMFKGADIVENDGKFRYFGELQEQQAPSESVSVVMFKLLQEKWLSMFDLRFQIYRKGYRQYTPEFLMNLEAAFVVGNVHPRKILLNNTDIKFIMRKQWEKIQEERKEGGKNFNASDHIQMVEKQSQNTLLRADRQAIRRLWELDKTGDLACLRQLMCEGQNIYELEDYESDVKLSSGYVIKQFLRARMNETIPIENIRRNVDLPQRLKSRPGVLLSKILMLALQGVPIVYDKDTYSVTLLDDERAPVVLSKENTNLFTMVYDLIKQYGKKLTNLEIVYFSGRLGHWTQGYDRQNLDELYKRISWYKEILAIQGRIEVCHCDCKKEQERFITLKNAMWEMTLNDNKALDLAHYRGLLQNVVQEDVDVINAVKAFEETPVFAVFMRHIQLADVEKNPQLERENFIKKSLQGRALPYKDLWDLCKRLGMYNAQDLWDAAKNLTQNTGDGRLLYLPKVGVFVWENADRYSVCEDSDRVAVIYSLQNDYPDMTDQELSHMLVQRGLPCADLCEAKKVLEGLEVIGLRHTKKDLCVEQRYLLEKMISSGLLKGIKNATEQTQENAIVQEVYSWLADGSMAKLWKAYLDAKEDELELAGLCNTEGGPSAKHPKLDDQMMSPEEIIRRDIPSLVEFMFEQGFYLL